MSEKSFSHPYLNQGGKGSKASADKHIKILKAYFSESICFLSLLYPSPVLLLTLSKQQESTSSSLSLLSEMGIIELNVGIKRKNKRPR